MSGEKPFDPISAHLNSEASRNVAPQTTVSESVAPPSATERVVAARAAHEQRESARSDRATNRADNAVGRYRDAKSAVGGFFGGLRDRVSKLSAERVIRATAMAPEAVGRKVDNVKTALETRGISAKERFGNFLRGKKDAASTRLSEIAAAVPQTPARVEAGVVKRYHDAVGGMQDKAAGFLARLASKLNGASENLGQSAHGHEESSQAVAAEARDRAERSRNNAGRLRGLRNFMSSFRSGVQGAKEGFKANYAANMTPATADYSI